MTAPSMLHLEISRAGGEPVGAAADAAGTWTDRGPQVRTGGAQASWCARLPALARPRLIM